MKYGRLISALALVTAVVISGLVLVACSTPDTPSSTPTQTQPTGSTSTASLGEEFTLSVGQSAVIDGEELKITFLDVTSDSRCPQGVTCIWAGEVSCLVEVTAGSLAPEKLVLTQPGSTDQAAIKDFQYYTMAFSISPYPTEDRQIATDEYRLTMTVTKKTQTGMEIEKAPIHDVKVAVTLSGQPEILVYIQGGLRNTCTTFSSLETVRNGDTVDITVSNQVITGVLCGQVYTYFERCTNLGSDFVSGRVYTVIVNDRTTTFTMP